MNRPNPQDAYPNQEISDYEFWQLVNEWAPFADEQDEEYNPDDDCFFCGKNSNPKSRHMCSICFKNENN